jgi:hypothetical protein
MESKLDRDYWSKRYQTNETGWDVGTPSTPLKEYIDQLENKNIKILIPGCGNAYWRQINTLIYPTYRRYGCPRKGFLRSFFLWRVRNKTFKLVTQGAQPIVIK